MALSYSCTLEMMYNRFPFLNKVLCITIASLCGPPQVVRNGLDPWVELPTVLSFGLLGYFFCDTLSQVPRIIVMVSKRIFIEAIPVCLSVAMEVILTP